MSLALLAAVAFTSFQLFDSWRTVKLWKYTVGANLENPFLLVPSQATENLTGKRLAAEKLAKAAEKSTDNEDKEVFKKIDREKMGTVMKQHVVNPVNEFLKSGIVKTIEDKERVKP